MVWAIILFGVAVILFLVELFLPSGGLLGMASAAALVTGVVLFFWIDTALGTISAIVTLIAIPFGIGFALKIWPQTPIGRMLMLGNTDAETAAKQSLTGRQDHMKLVGTRGRALTDLRPVGTCEINGKREECLAIGTMIDTGAIVEVTRSNGMQLEVREVESTT